jgi:hypothetical protein
VSATENAFAAEYWPTFMQRTWRRLGWRYQMVDLPETPEVEHMPGWAMTRVLLDFSLGDRLRLLLTGRVRLDIRQKLSADVADIVSATSIEILPPGRDFHG